MTAAINTRIHDTIQHATALNESAVGLAELDEFLRDPIGYGEYDFSDPITLSDFSSSRHMHARFVDLLT